MKAPFDFLLQFRLCDKLIFCLNYFPNLKEEDKFD